MRTLDLILRLLVLCAVAFNMWAMWLVFKAVQVWGRVTKSLERLTEDWQVEMERTNGKTT